ncbi:hypothetical protein [Nocardioides sp. zg-1228]|uniref:hypothetical protein n=1 Tax=Nocardioides sp. zg-1228 TaxID=2763008 RepID=UPI0016435C66|nr:hypothetical protein [Nocardioides sp. zg-1228]MBC2932320.1 hypothetical protein [Nocardioides sp. zg-1228]QSF57836.1 hypothetical protein JX575_00945 [Nocardioides sp. zg-1228]
MIGRVPLDGEELFHAWERAIDALERDVLLAEGFVADPAGVLARGAELPSGWVPTELEGTIPATLVPRAAALLRRQAAVREQLAGAVGSARVDLARLRRTAPVARATGPAYVDLSA